MRTTHLIGTSLALTLVACIPARDNVNDPQNAPAAALQVVGVPHVDGTCPPTVEAWPEVLTGSRGMCLALDATGTTADSPIDQLTFRYERIDACGSTPAVLQGTAATLILDRSMLRLCPLGTPIDFSVVVTNRAGGRSRSEARIVLQNGRPVAEAGPTRSFPVGGYAWNPGEAFDIQFSGRGSFDPDADPLTYCFEFDDEAQVCSTDRDSPLFRRAAGPARDIVAASLRVHDGDPLDPALDALRLASSIDKTVAYVREQNIWLTAEGFYERVDGVLSALTSPASLARDVEFLPSATIPSVIIPFGTDIGTAPWPAATPMTTVIAGGASSLVGFAADPGGNRVWSVQEEIVVAAGCPAVVAGDNTTVRSWDLTTYTQLSCDHAELFTTDFLDNFVATGGSIWGARLLGTSMMAAGSTGLVTTVTDERRILSGVAVRPETDEAWALWSPDFFNGTGDTFASARFVRYASSAPSTAIGLPLELLDDFSFGFEWVDHDLAWITLGAKGLVLLDVAALESGRTLEDAILVRVPDVVALLIVVDRPSGTLWTSGPLGALRVTLDGTVTVYPGDEQFTPILADSGGYLWFRNDAGLSRGLAPGPASVSELNVLAIASGAFDEQTGGVWIPVAIPRSIARVAEDGTRLRTIGSLTLNGVTGFVPFLKGLRAIPGTETLFGFVVTATGEQTSGAIRIDARELGKATDPATATTFLGPVEAQDILSLGGTLDATVPDATGTSFLWTISNASAPKVVTMTTAGTMIAERLSIPAGSWDPSFDKVLGAVSPSDDRFCFAFVDSSAATVSVRSIPPSGTLPVATSIPLPFGGELMAVASTPGMCWVGFRSFNGEGTSNIFGVTYAGAVTRTHADTAGALMSIQPLGASDVWFAFRNTTTDAVYKAHLTGYSGGAYVTRVVFEILQTDSDAIFVASGVRTDEN